MKKLLGTPTASPFSLAAGAFAAAAFLGGILVFEVVAEGRDCAVLSRGYGRVCVDVGGRIGCGQKSELIYVKEPSLVIWRSELGCTGGEGKIVFRTCDEVNSERATGKHDYATPISSASSKDMRSFSLSLVYGTYRCKHTHRSFNRGFCI